MLQNHWSNVARDLSRVNATASFQSCSMSPARDCTVALWSVQDCGFAASAFETISARAVGTCSPYVPSFGQTRIPVPSFSTCCGENDGMRRTASTDFPQLFPEIRNWDKEPLFPAVQSDGELGTYAVLTPADPRRNPRQACPTRRKRGVSPARLSRP